MLRNYYTIWNGNEERPIALKSRLWGIPANLMIVFSVWSQAAASNRNGTVWHCSLEHSQLSCCVFLRPDCSRPVRWERWKNHTSYRCVQSESHRHQDGEMWSLTFVCLCLVGLITAQANLFGDVALQGRERQCQLCLSLDIFIFLTRSICS